MRISRPWVVAAPLLVMIITGCADGGRLSLTPTRPADVARNAFNLHDADLRRRSVVDLANAPFGGEEPYVRMYRMLADDPDATVRAAAVKALGQHGEVEDAALIAERLRDEAPFVRWQAARALQKIHDPSVAPALIAALGTDEDVDVRMAAARALGQYPQPAVVQALVAALDDGNFGVVRAAHGSLRTLTGRDLGIDPRPWLQWTRANPQSLFERQRPYGWRPYAESPGLIERTQFWRKPDPQRIPPRGLPEAG